MGSGTSPLGKTNKGASKLSTGGGKPTGNKLISDIKASITSGDMNNAADLLNDNVETAGYLMLEDGDDILIFGKPYNDHFTDIAPGSRTSDSIGMAKKINDLDGKWSVHKYDGQVQFPASSVSKKAGVGFLNAITIAKLPTNVQTKKILTTPDGNYDVFEITGANPSAMFRYVSVKK